MLVWGTILGARFSRRNRQVPVLMKLSDSDTCSYHMHMCVHWYNIRVWVSSLCQCLTTCFMPVRKDMECSSLYYHLAFSFMGMPKKSKCLGKFCYLISLVSLTENKVKLKMWRQNLSELHLLLLWRWVFSDDQDFTIFPGNINS